MIVRYKMITYNWKTNRETDANKESSACIQEKHNCTNILHSIDDIGVKTEFIYIFLFLSIFFNLFFNSYNERLY